MNDAFVASALSGRRRSQLTALLSLSLLAPAFAQTTDVGAPVEKKEEEVIVLSPFQVDASNHSFDLRSERAERFYDYLPLAFKILYRNRHVTFARSRDKDRHANF